VPAALAHGPVPAARYGDRGLSVACVQRGLRLLNYSSVTMDGIFGPKTLAAVKSFQSSVRLSADGIVGRLTGGALISEVYHRMGGDGTRAFSFIVPPFPGIPAGHVNQGCHVIGGTAYIGHQ
jgi:peptidoglycan hydrolase-like protein with peptidoglycan-binding domain